MTEEVTSLSPGTGDQVHPCPQVVPLERLSSAEVKDGRNQRVISRFVGQDEEHVDHLDYH